MASDNAQPRRIRSGTAHSPGRSQARNPARNPLAVVLSAPVRFLADRLTSDRLRFRGGRPGPDAGPEPSGDREPRRPKPTPPGDSVALSEPRG